MNELLEKYWEGTTSHEEEQRLKRYFASGNITAAHEVYKPLFETIALEQQVLPSFDAFAKVSNKTSLWTQFNNHKWKSLAVAASLAAILTLGAVYQDSVAIEPDLGTYDNPVEAYEATVTALQFMGTKINAGKANLEPLHKLEAKKNEVFKRESLKRVIDSSENRK
jgi:anti-sigma-K factor RskA